MNISSRKIAIMFLSLLLLIMNGCANSDTPQDKVQGNPGVIDQPKNQSVGPALVGTKEADPFEAVEFEKKPGWKEIKASVSLSELCEQGSKPMNDNKKYSFSIHFPGSWTMIASVLYDANNKKVAEIPPPILLKSEQEAVFLDYNPAIDHGEELIAKEEIEINSYHGSKTITKIPTESGNWYPHIYRLIDETNGFTIIFYSETINKNDQALFDEIVNTLASGR